MSSLSHIYPVYIAGILIHIVYVMQRIKSSFNTSICKRSLPVFHQQCGSHYEHKLIMLFLTWAQFQFDHDMKNNGTNRGNFTSEVIFNLLLLTLLNSSMTKMHVQLYYKSNDCSKQRIVGPLRGCLLLAQFRTWKGKIHLPAGKNRNSRPCDEFFADCTMRWKLFAAEVFSYFSFLSFNRRQLVVTHALGVDLCEIYLVMI
jgi:hypothetical protein